MKKIVSLLCAVLTLCLCMSGALAVNATYTNTQEFLELLDAKDIIYTLEGMDSKDHELVTIKNKGDAFSYTVSMGFYKDNESVSIRVWNIIEYDAADYVKVAQACNNINYTYRFTRFFPDETDNTVTCAYDMVLREGGVSADVIWEALVRVVNILDEGYEQLCIYAK